MTEPCPRCGSTDRVSNGAGRTRCAECNRRRKRAQTDASLHAVGAPEGYRLKGVSTLTNIEGRPTWVKTTEDPRALRDAFEDVLTDLPRAPLIDPPETVDQDLMNVIPLGDPHLGMLSWAPETGEDFDLDIATDNLLAGADWLMGRIPLASVCLLINCGDFFHSDNMDARTARSGHQLDVDGRWPKILRAGVALMCQIIERALETHPFVIVRNEIGNHDDHSAIMLSIALGMRYADNPRVHIEQSPSKYWYHRFGRCLIGTTHGNGVKLADLGEIMAFDRAEDWGETLFRHWYVGHVHHESVKERRGVVVETFRTLAARDAWHHAAGYRSGRDMRCDTWHREFGLEARHIVGIERLRV